MATNICHQEHNSFNKANLFMPTFLTTIAHILLSCQRQLPLWNDCRMLMIFILPTLGNVQNSGRYIINKKKLSDGATQSNNEH